MDIYMYFFSDLVLTLSNPGSVQNGKHSEFVILYQSTNFSQQITWPSYFGTANLLQAWPPGPVT